jgi:hypothetical protein
VTTGILATTASIKSSSTGAREAERKVFRGDWWHIVAPLDGGEEERDPAGDDNEHLDRITLDGGEEKRASVTDGDEHLKREYNLGTRRSTEMKSFILKAFVQPTYETIISLDIISHVMNKQMATIFATT